MSTLYSPIGDPDQDLTADREEISRFCDVLFRYAETGFLFHAAHQGWYWFIVQAQYLDGRNVPPDLNTVQPGLKVCVDTIPPAVALKQVQPREGTLGRATERPPICT